MSDGAEKLSVGRVEVVVEERPGWVKVHAVFPSEFQRQVEFERTPGLIDRTLTHWLHGHPRRPCPCHPRHPRRRIHGGRPHLV